MVTPVKPEDKEILTGVTCYDIAGNPDWNLEPFDPDILSDSFPGATTSIKVLKGA